MSESPAPMIKVRKIAGQADAFEVLLDDAIIGHVTKTKRSVSAKQGRTRTGFATKTAWAFSVTADDVPLGHRFGTVITTKQDAVDLIVERVTTARTEIV